MNPGLDYFKSRHINLETMKNFKLGFSDGKQISLLGSVDHSWKTYLLNQKPNIKNHLIFPVMDISGKVRAIAFRNVSRKDFLSNSNFKKTNYLYGIHNALEAAHKSNFVIVVEGLFDALVGHSLGLNNVVAVFGSHISFNQACLLKRFTDKVLIIGDGDEGGSILIKQGTKVLRSMGIQTKSLYVSKKDPDELFLENKNQFLEF